MDYEIPGLVPVETATAFGTGGKVATVDSTRRTISPRIWAGAAPRRTAAVHAQGGCAGPEASRGESRHRLVTLLTGLDGLDGLDHSGHGALRLSSSKA